MPLKEVKLCDVLWWIVRFIWSLPLRKRNGCRDEDEESFACPIHCHTQVFVQIYELIPAINWLVYPQAIPLIHLLLHDRDLYATDHIRVSSCNANTIIDTMIDGNAPIVLLLSMPTTNAINKSHCVDNKGCMYLTMAERSTLWAD